MAVGEGLSSVVPHRGRLTVICSGAAIFRVLLGNTVFFFVSKTVKICNG